MAQHDTCRFYIAESSTVVFDHFTRHFLSQKCKDDVYAFFIAHEQMTAKHRLPAKIFQDILLLLWGNPPAW